MPVLTGVDAASTYCYLLAMEHRDADIWGVHLLDTAKQGLKHDYNRRCRAGLACRAKAARDDTPCHSDVFHIQRHCEAWPTRCHASARRRRWQCHA
jgi:hypothetical protein